MKTTARWVDHFAVECYSDANYQNFVTQGTSGAKWDGTYNHQIDTIVLPGLTMGQQYYLRAASIAPLSDPSAGANWSFYTMVAGVSTSPTSLFGVTISTSFGGVDFNVTVTSTPADIDHYEATWTVNDPTTPVDASIARWKGYANGGKFYFHIGGVQNGATVYVYLRAVNTSGAKQPWTLIGAPSASYLDFTGKGLGPNGSIPPVVANGMSYVSNFQAIAWFWDGTNGSSFITIYRMDGGTIQVPASRVGTTNLPNQNYVYYFYPYFKEIVAGGPGVGFSGGGVGTNDPMFNTTGGDSLAYLNRDLSALSNTNRPQYIPLSDGGMPAQTTTSPTGTVGGGGGGVGGGVGCPRRGMKVIERTKGTIPVEQVRKGDWLLSKGNEWTEVVRFQAVEESTFIRLTMPDGEYIDQSPETPMPLRDGTDKRTAELSLGDVLCVREHESGEEHHSNLRKIEVIDERDLKFHITCAPAHTFYAGAVEPTILTHNLLMSSRK